MMNARHSVPAALVLALVSSVSAFAQGTPAPGTTVEPRWYIAALGGAVSRPPTEPVFGVEVAQNVGRHGQAYTTFSYFENLMQRSLRDSLDAKAAQLTTLTGDTWSLSGRDRGVAFVAGGKYLFGSGSVRPYVGAGLGAINLRRTVLEARLGDVTRAVFNDFELGEADLSLATEGITRPLVEAAFGVGIGSGRTHFDIGYRYRSAYRMTSKLDFSQVTAGIGYRF
jgi:opacity protein-like surface antigen